MAFHIVSEIHAKYDEQGEVRAFKLFLKQYVYSSSKDAFLPTPGMPDHLPRQICDALAVLHDISTGMLLHHMLQGLC